MSDRQLLQEKVRMRKMEQANESRRRFVKKALYIPPAIATLTVLPAFAQSGSGQPENGPQVEQDNLQVSQNTVASTAASASTGPNRRLWK